MSEKLLHKIKQNQGQNHNLKVTKLTDFKRQRKLNIDSFMNDDEYYNDSYIGVETPRLPSTPTINSHIINRDQTISNILDSESIAFDTFRDNSIEKAKEPSNSKHAYGLSFGPPKRL